MVFLAAAANIGVGTLLCGKAAAETEERKKDTHGTAKRGREGGEADVRVVQCLIHASAVSDSVSNAQAFKLRGCIGQVSFPLGWDNASLVCFVAIVLGGQIMNMK